MHENGRSLEWKCFKCWATVLRVLKLRLQILHWNGLSPVCTRTWSSSREGNRKDFWHTQQVYCFLSLWLGFIFVEGGGQSATNLYILQFWVPSKKVSFGVSLGKAYPVLVEKLMTEDKNAAQFQQECLLWFKQIYVDCCAQRLKNLNDLEMRKQKVPKKNGYAFVKSTLTTDSPVVPCLFFNRALTYI